MDIYRYIMDIIFILRVGIATLASAGFSIRLHSFCGKYPWIFLSRAFWLRDSKQSHAVTRIHSSDLSFCLTPLLKTFSFPLWRVPALFKRTALHLCSALLSSPNPTNLRGQTSPWPFQAQKLIFPRPSYVGTFPSHCQDLPASRGNPGSSEFHCAQLIYTHPPPGHCHRTTFSSVPGII